MISLLILSLFLPVLYWVSLLLLCALFTCTMVDTLIIYGKQQKVFVKRELSEKLSLGDENPVKYTVQSSLNFKTQIQVIDEFPVQLQIRDFVFKSEMQPEQEEHFQMQIIPDERGEYTFGNINVFFSGPFRLSKRRIILPAEQKVSVYPSIIQMKNFELKFFSKFSQLSGIKRIRKLGLNNEFEQIKNYVQGDDYRKINWKATSRRKNLMINQFQEEKSQMVYSLVDKSRVMRMPFEGLTLLDLSINSSLVFSNIVVNKGDKAGLLTFSDKIGQHVKASSRPQQVRLILETLYRQKTEFNEVNYNTLYHGVRQFIRSRSMLMIYTNFESMYSLQRALPAIRKLNKLHLVVIVMFENTEVAELSQVESYQMSDIYLKTIAEKSILEKKLMAQELAKYGIHCVLTSPKDLSVNTINKYLEIKSRGAL